MMPPTPPPQASHALVQFLNGILSQRGPNALPYEEDLKMMIRQHLVALIQNFPTLHAKPALFTHNDGKVGTFLQVEGTIPMYYNDVMYNIPITIWLLEAYPRSAPRVFVTPTKDMIIKRPHRNVDLSGLVSVSYIQSWIFPRSNLLELVHSLSLLFGQDPPLYSRPRTPAASPATSHIPPSSSSSSSLSSSSSSSTSLTSSSSSPSLNSSSFLHANPNHANPSSSGLPTPPQAYPGPGQYGRAYSQYPPSPQRANIQTENAAEVFKRNAINTLVERMQKDMNRVRKAQEGDVDTLMNTQSILRQREAQLNSGLQELWQEKEGLEKKLQDILTNVNILESWLASNGQKEDIKDIDQVFKPCDIFSKQLLDSSSADLAIEDLLYFLDRAAQDGAIPAHTYLKHIRSLSREQFYHRATMLKVRQVQNQAQVSNMAARAGQYVT